VNGLDLILIVLAAFAAYGGWRLGFLRRLSGWVGAALGLALAIMVLPSLVERMSLQSDLSVVLVSTALLVLLASIGQGIGAAIGARLRAEVDSPAARHLDATGGLLLGIVGVAVLAWLVVPVMADAEGWPSASTRGSTLAALVDEHLPDPPPQITRLERQLAGGGYPQLFTGLRRAPDIPAAPSGSTVTQEVLDDAARSVVRLQSDACGRIQSGSGFVVADGIVATNAHVVAGSDTIELTTPDGTRANGVVVAFDPAVDLALVATDLDRPPLPVAAPAEDDQGLVMGFPGGGPFAPSPFAIGELLDARGYDIYDRATVDRQILALASALEPGDSGSAVLRADGSVVGVAVAVAPDRPEVAYALNSAELERLLGRGATGRVSSGACTR
jgi:S1-C subfamily serine protease